MKDSAQPRIFPFEVNNSENRTALVAGGSGFVGALICEQLLSKGYRVVCVDNLTSGNKDNVKHLLNTSGFTFVKADINNPDFSIPNEINLDIIFHAAGLEEFSVEKDLSIETLLVNSLGTRVLLELAKSRGAKFVFISSADLYSGVFSSTSLKYYFGKNPENESTFTHNEAKRFAEALVFEYFKNYDITAVIVRVKDLYGPRMNLNSEGGINKLFKQVIYDAKIIIPGDGLKILNPTYVTDAVSGIVKAGLVGAKGEIYNLVNPEKITLVSLAQVVKQVLGYVNITHKGSSEHLDIPYHQLDLSTSIEKLDWRPMIGLADGIFQTVAYFRKPREEKTNSQHPTTKPLFVGAAQNTNKNKSRKIPLISHVRLIIFLAALALVVLTIIYPGGALVLDTYLANNSFKESIKNLEVDRVGISAEKANEAATYYNRAAQDFRTLNWLTQIVANREKLNAIEDFYFIGEKLSKSTNAISKSLDILISITSANGVSDEEAQEAIKKVESEALEAKKQLDLSSSNLSQLNQDKLPNSLVNDLEEFKRAEKILGEIIVQLLNST